MAEEINIDEFDLTPSEDELENRKKFNEAQVKEKEKIAKAEEELVSRPKVIDVPGLGLPDKERTTGEVVKDFLFGPKGVELSGPGKAPKLVRRIIERVEGVPEDQLEPIGETDIFTDFTAGVIDGTIKIPYGLVNISAEIYDALREDNVPVDEGAVATLEKYFSNSVLGKIQQGAEDVVKGNSYRKVNKWTYTAL